MTPKLRITRRSMLAAALPLVHSRTASAAGKLAVAFPSSFVPGWDDAIRRLVEAWGQQNVVEVQVDFLSLTNNQVLFTVEAEAQAHAGHDIVTLGNYSAAHYSDQLEPVDGLVNQLIAAHGPLIEGVEHLAKIAGAWRAVPTGMTSLYWPIESRIDLFRELVGLDVQVTFPAAAQMGPGYDQWTWNAFLIAAEKCFKAGMPFGLPISNCADANVWLAALFQSFGATLIDAEANVAIKSDAVREALDYLKRLGQFLPPEVYTWNNSSNNRALIAGKSALIINPPSAWASATTSSPSIAKQIWHHPLPAGKSGRFLPWGPDFLAIWNFSPHKSAAKDLIAWLGERTQVEASLIASQGYDVPPFAQLTDFPIWAEAGPPKGTLFNYPLRAVHHARVSIVGAPAPPVIANQIFSQWVLPKLVGRVTQQGVLIEDAIEAAERDLAAIIARR
jgi:Bacterial extracellular solute-binding protein